MKALKFSVTLGVIPGYGHHNEFNESSEQIVAYAWQQAMEKVGAQVGVYVTASCTPALMVYRTEWGCPNGGEIAVTISGCQNSHFCESPPEYKNAVILCVQRCQELLEQTTAFIEFTEVDTVYLRKES